MSVDDLPDAEVEVLAALWDRGESTAREVRESLSPFRPMTHGAVFTLLRRLEEKGMVRRRKGDRGKAYVYRAKVRPQRTYRRLAGDLLERVFRGRSVDLVSSLFETAPPTTTDIDQLQCMLDGLRQERGRCRDQAGDAKDKSGDEVPPESRPSEEGSSERRS